MNIRAVELRRGQRAAQIAALCRLRGAWKLKDEIIQQMHHVAAWDAKFVAPIPFVTIIDPAELQR